MLLFSSAYNEYTVISKEYTGPLGFDIMGVDCINISFYLDSPMSILDDRGGGWRSISCTNNVGHCRGSTGDI